MDANDWNGLLAGTILIALGVGALAGFAWYVRGGIAAYTEKLREHCRRIGNPYADDERGLRTLAIAKLAGTAGLGLIMLAGGVLLIVMTVGWR